MTLDPIPPSLYFRIRDPGAAVFRVATQTPQKRLELDLIAVANIRTGEIKPVGAGPDAGEMAEITAWMSKRKSSRGQREARDLQSLIEILNRSAHWLQTRASKGALVAQAQDLLFAMHDLRSVVVRRLAESDEKSETEE